MFKFRKIASVLASGLMAGSTVALAAAANYPAPFVSGGTPNVAVVYGSNAVGGVDLAAASNIITDLSGEVVTGSASGSTSTVTGESFQLAKTSDQFNLGNTANSFYATIDDDQLSTILAPGIYNNDNNDEFEYTQELAIGALTLEHFQDSDFNDEKPVIGFNLPDGTHVLNYTLDFTPDNAEGGASWNDFEGTTLELLGKEYYILSAANSTGAETLTLLDSANTVMLTEGDTVTVEVGDTSYDVSISFIGTTSVRLNINGEVTPALNEDDTRKLSTGDYVGIREILVQDYAGGVKQVEFSIGSGKIELTNGEEVQVNGEDMSDSYDHVITSYITQTASGELDKITLDWMVDQDMWLAFGTDSTEMAMPLFGSIKMNLGNFVIDAEEKTTVKYDGDNKFKLDTTLTDGDVSFNILYTNSSNHGFAGLGKDSDERLLTNATTSPTYSIDMDTHSWFVATWINGDDAESFVLEVTKVDDSDPATNVTTIKSIASGSNEGATVDLTDTDEIGTRITATLLAADEEDKTAVIRLTPTSGGTVYGDRLVTEEGLTMYLPVDSVTAGTHNLNITGAQSNTTDTIYEPTSFTMTFTEETQDGDITGGSSFTATLSMTGAEATVSAVNVTDYETSDGSDDFEGYVESDLATTTFLRTGGDQDDLEITYHGTEAYGEVFISESGAVLSDGETGPIGPAMLDTDVTASLNKNLIVVGGSCVNTVAAELLGSSTPLCGPDFTAATGVGSGSFLIQTFERADKVATLVAGYNAGDTTNAAQALITQTIDTTAGKKYTGTTATSVEAVTTTA